MSQNSFKTTLLRSTILVGAAVIATSASAQQTAAAEPTAEEIVVTGSLIKNPNLERSAPVNVTTADEIELKNSNVAEELLREIPGIVPSIGSAVNNGNNGASFVNLRGLGSNRNIVLLDGNRIVPAELQGRFDLNNVPLALVDRVDVLTGGASTTYGADAISGVVNFLTKQDFAGAEINVGNEITEEGDGHTFRADLTIGANFDDGRGNATFSIGYQESDPVFQGDRKFSENTLDTYSGGAVGSGTSVPSRFSVPGVGTLQVQPTTGTLVPTFQTFNFNPLNVFQTPFERFNMYGTAKYEIADGVEVYTRGMFSKNTVRTIIAPSGAFGISVQIPLSNPFLPTAVRNTFCANNDSNPTLAGIQTLTTAQCAAAATALTPTDPNYREVTTALFRRSVEAGPRTSTYGTTLFDYQAGVRGSVTESINWDMSGSYGESENIETIGGYFLNSRVRQSLRSTNATTCLDTSNGCVPANFFGAAGTIQANAIPFLTAASQVTVRTTLAQARGTVSGDFGQSLPTAQDPIAFAVGAEYRSYGAQQQSDLLASAGDLGGAGGADPNINGGYNAKEIFGEVAIPLIQDRPGFQNLSVNGGIRYSDYSVDAPGNPSYSTTTWKGEANWEPVAGLNLRGTYSRAVRAPNINELFSPVNTGLTNLGDDPCANIAANGTRIAGRPNPTGELRAICLAQGAPVATIGFIEQPIAGQANSTGGGNLNIGPEKSNSYTIGAVLRPEQVPGFSITLDYYNIKVKGAITQPTPADALAACFGATPFNNPAAGASTTEACTQIRRDPQTGGLNGDPNTTRGLFLTLSNAGALSTDGFDLSMNYSRDIGFAKLGLSFNGNYTLSNKFNAFVANPASINRECVGYISANCGSLQPKFQWSQRTTLSFDQVDVSLLWRHIDNMVQEPLDVAAGGAFFRGSTVPGFVGQQFDFGKISSYNYFDLSTRVSVMDNLTLTFVVQNLLNKKPPITGNNAGSTAFNSGNTFPSTYDALGRSFGMNARLKF